MAVSFKFIDIYQVFGKKLFSHMGNLIILLRVNKILTFYHIIE